MFNNGYHRLQYGGLLQIHDPGQERKSNNVVRVDCRIHRHEEGANSRYEIVDVQFF